MKIRFLYFDDCPHWQVAHQRLTEVLADLPNPPAVEMVAVTSPEQADQVGFLGSPSIQVDGHDLFASGDEPVGLSCRVYQTSDGQAGSPTLAQLRAAVEA